MKKFPRRPLTGSNYLHMPKKRGFLVPKRNSFSKVLTTLAEMDASFSLDCELTKP